MALNNVDFEHFFPYDLLLLVTFSVKFEVVLLFGNIGIKFR